MTERSSKPIARYLPQAASHHPQRMRNLRIIVAVLALFCSIATPSGAAADRIHKILIVHSYHQGLAWTDSISEGIRSALVPFDRRIELYFEYLDIKRRPRPLSEEDLPAYFQPDSGFDVVITADEEAFELVHRREIGSGPVLPVVFCGISRFEPATINPAQAVTGVLETGAHRDNVNLMVALHKQSKRFVLLFDWNVSGTLFEPELADIVKIIPSHLTVDIWRNPSLDELPAKLQALDADDLIYMLAVNRDKNLNYLFSSEAVHLVTRWSPAPVYSPLAAYIGKGIVGGRITSGFHQGEMAAQLALRIISGDPAGSIPVVTHSTNPYIFDYRQLKRFGIKASNLPTGSVFIGQPAPFITRWAKTISFISAAALLTALLMLGGILRLLKKRHALLQAKTEIDNRLKEKAVQLQLVHQKLKKQALVDPLTGLANRRSIIARCAEEIKRTQRYGHAFTIAMLDLDNFKRINTNFGYIVGDKILKDIAHAVKRGIRETDTVGRFSGEAFLILLPDTDLAAAQRSAQRLLAAVAALHWEKKQVKTTVSIGLAEYSGQGLPALTAMAEDRQLQAKALGGNQIVSL